MVLYDFKLFIILRSYSSIINHYRRELKSLRISKRNGGAPHKPILLISIIEAYENGMFDDNKIFIIPESVQNFKRIWTELVDTNHHPIFALPFYHMKSESFWELSPNIGYEKVIASRASLKGSFNTLHEAINHAKIEDDLKDLLLDEESRLMLKLTLLDYYFPNTKRLYQTSNDIDKSFIYDQVDNYYKNLEHLKVNLDSNSLQEDLFVRSGIFKREIPKIYDFTCAISKMRINPTTNASLVDACHIIPFSISQDDTVGNGISLCPNLHRDFDRGLIFIDENYTVRINNNFTDNLSSSYNIKQFEGERIMLPKNPDYRPKIKNLIEHKTRFNRT